VTLERTLTALLGDKLGVATCLLGEAEEGPLDEEAALFSSSSELRVRSFRAGRTAARRALAKLGEPAMSIGVGAGREPMFPPRLRGSISHSKELAIAVVAPSSDVRSIGVDLERTRELAPRVIERVANAAERAGLSALHALVLFSAKESIYKALYPEVGRWFGFEAAIVSVRHDAAWTATLPTDLSPSWRAGSTVTGVWAERDGFVVTACVTWS
jgi:4'-phosphopantetheinyl transferase EntD